MSNEWYTPATYIEAARIVMGGSIWTRQAASGRIGSCEPRPTTPKIGRVWCNPPYGRCRGSKDGKSISHQQAFAEKLQREYARGGVEQAILLSLGNPNSIWFQPLLDYTLCFHRRHIDFYHPDGTTGKFGFPLAFIYLGPHEGCFTEVFSQFGRIVRAIDAPKPCPVNRELWEEGMSA